MDSGDTFLGPLSYTPHLWLVLTPPNKQGDVALVNFTSKIIDQTCLVNPGEHLFVKQPTCVRYQDAKICQLAVLERSLAKGEFRRDEPVSATLLERIRAGALDSPFTPGKVIREIRRAMGQ